MASAPLDEEAIFKVACKIASPEARADYLRQACGDDLGLRDRLVALLRVHDEEPSFLESPHPGEAAFIESPPSSEQPGQSIGVPDAATALMWLRRLRGSVGRVRALQNRERFFSVANVLKVGVVGFFHGCFLAGALCSSIESVWGSDWLKAPSLTTIPLLGFVIGAVLSGYLVWRLPSTYYRKQRERLEATIGVDALEVVRRFPDLVSELFGSRDHLANPDALREAIAFLERQPVGRSPVAAAATGMGGGNPAAHDMQNGDPRVGLLWLRRLRKPLDERQIARKRTALTTGSLACAYVIAVVGAFFLFAVPWTFICRDLLKWDSEDGPYSAGMTLSLFGGGPLIGYVYCKYRIKHYRRKASEIEARVHPQVDDFVQTFPEMFRNLFRNKEDLLESERVVEAIAFLERESRPVPSGGDLRGEESPVGPERPPCLGQMIGGCRLVRRLGEGAMGTAYAARHLRLDIPVVVKVLRTELTRQGTCVERFVQEARTAARLKHPNIVGVYDVGSEAGVHFIVMELVEGGSLQELLGRERRLPPARAVKLVRDVCQGLQYAHENQIVHRDIKPANILLDASGMGKVADLGLARRLGDDFGMTQSGMIMGTPYYLSPEQAVDAKRADHRADIYSLGCMFYEMVCGTVPYAGDTLARIILAHAQAPIPDPRVQAPGISERLANIVVRMMAKRPADRFQSIRDVLDALSQTGARH